MKTILAICSAVTLAVFSLSANAAYIEIWDSDAGVFSLADSDDLIASGDADFKTIFDGLIDFDDLGDGTTGFSGLDFAWPGGVDSDFVARITGSIDVMSDALWGIFVNHDDGVRVTLNGDVIILADGIVDNRTSGSQTNASLLAGSNVVEIIFFEHLGGASLEFYAGPSGTVDPRSGNPSGLQTVSEPGTLALLGIGLLCLGLAGRKAA